MSLVIPPAPTALRPPPTATASPADPLAPPALDALADELHALANAREARGDVGFPAASFRRLAELGLLAAPLPRSEGGDRKSVV